MHSAGNNTCSSLQLQCRDLWVSLCKPQSSGYCHAELTSQSSGTITATIDEVVLTPGQPVVRDSLAERPLAVLQAGDALMGAVIVPTGAAGSIMGVIVYKWVPGR